MNVLEEEHNLHHGLPALTILTPNVKCIQPDGQSEVGDVAEAASDVVSVYLFVALGRLV